jgi:hypothetical protein
LRYEVYIRVQVGSTGPLDWAGVDDLTIHADFQAYASSLPALDIGRNDILYLDETPEPHRVVIQHRWKESSVVTPPGTSPSPVFPPNGTNHRGFDVVFRWETAPPGSGAIADYQFFLSDREDLAWPLAPNFETFVGSSIPELPVPEASYFLPGVVYYWRVRAVDEWGVFGPWSETWTFRVDGPGRPIGLRKEIDGRRISISWEPNPEGTTPVRYEIYASDERGFEANDHPYPGRDRSPDPEGRYPTLPANLLASTKEPCIVVVDEMNPNPLANRVFYRIKAVDAAGIRSAPSGYLEVNHPFIYSTPNTEVRAGVSYSYQVRTTRSLGDLQWNRVPPKPEGMSFLYEDSLVFVLSRAPDWLFIDQTTGLITGTPPSSAVGPHEVAVKVTAYDTSPDEGPRVRSEDEQRFVLRVNPYTDSC